MPYTRTLGHARPRLLIAVATAALTLLSGTTAQAQRIEGPDSGPRGTDDACPQNLFDYFDDDQGSVHERAINCLADFAIARGNGTGQFQPASDVSRAAMASFIVRTAETAGFDFPENPTDAFDDDNGNIHEPAINALASVGVTRGTGGRTYSPGKAVTRGEMASFSNRMIDLVTGSPLRGVDDAFEDDNNSAHQGNINGLAWGGVVAGVTPTTYAPNRSITRGQAASILARAADVMAQTGDWPDLPGATFTIAPDTDQFPVVSSTQSTDDTPAPDNRGRTTVTIAGLQPTETLSLALFPAENVVEEPGGNIALRSTTPLARSNRASFETIGGRLIGRAEGPVVTELHRVGPDPDGTITLTVDALEPQAVRVVAWSDNGDEQLGTVATPTSLVPARPIEDAAATADITWMPLEAAPLQFIGRTVVTAVDRNDSQLAVDTDSPPDGRADLTLRWTAADSYGTDDDNVIDLNVRPAALDEWERWVSPGDVLGPIPVYRPGENAFNIIGDIPGAPALGAAGVTRDGLTLQVPVAAATNPIAQSAQNAAAYQLQRSVQLTTSDFGPWRNIGPAVAGSATPVITATSHDTGTWRYRIVARSVACQDRVVCRPARDTDVTSDTFKITFEPELLPPRSTELTVQDTGASGDGAPNGTLDVGDTLTIAFDRAVTVADEWTLDLLDAEGDRVQLSAQNADVFVGLDRRTATIVLDSLPTVVTAVDDAAIDLSGAADAFAQVRAVTGIANAAGDWHLAASRIEMDATGPGTPLSASIRLDAVRRYGPRALGDLTGIDTPESTPITAAAPNTVTLQANSGIAAGDRLRVWSVAGELLVDDVIVDPAQISTHATSAAIADGDVLYVEYIDSSRGDAASRSRRIVVGRAMLTDATVTGGVFGDGQGTVVTDDFLTVTYTADVEPGSLGSRPNGASEALLDGDGLNALTGTNVFDVDTRAIARHTGARTVEVQLLRIGGGLLRTGDALAGSAAATRAAVWPGITLRQAN